MALDYKSSLGKYRRYLEAVEKRPLFRASLFVVFSLVLVIALVLWALRPTLVTISGLIGTIKQQREVEEKLNAKILALQHAQETYLQLQPRLPLLDQGLPMSPEVAKWAASVERIASDSGMELVSVNIDKIVLKGEATGAGIMNVGFSINGRGQYSQFRTFVGGLESMRRVVDLSNVQMSSGKEGKMSLTVKGVFGFYAQTQN